MASKKTPRPKKSSTKPEKAPERQTKRNDGKAFEERARDALGFLHPGLDAQHNVKLESKYGRTRQFDVGLASGGTFEKLYEAKDYAKPVPLEKAEAFETKTSELKSPPTGGGLISAHGFQQGVIDRARELGEDLRAPELLQLRAVEEADWERRVKQLEVVVRARQLRPDDIFIELQGEPRELPFLSAERRDCFVFDGRGRVVGNVLDEINDRLLALAVPADAKPGEFPRQCVDFAEDRYVDLSGTRMRIKRFEFTPQPVHLGSTVSLDLASAAKDVVLDCLKGTTHIIPDPELALRASRSGHALSLSFGTDDGGLEEAFRAPADTGTTEDNNLSALANSLKLQLLLGALGRESQTAPAEVAALLDEGTAAFVAEDYSRAETLYRQSLEHGVSIVALVNLSFLEHRKGNVDAALRLATATACTFPLEPHGFANAAAVLIAARRLDEAEKVLSAAQLLHAGRPGVIRHHAELLYLQGKYEAAARMFTDLRAMEPLDASHRFGLALCADAMRDRSHAAYDAWDAWRLGTTTREQDARIAHILIRAGWCEEALEVARTSLERHGDDAELRLDAAVAAYEAGNLDEAERLSVGLSDANATVVYHRGLLLYARGDARGAYEQFRAYVVRRAEDANGYDSLTVTATQAGLYEEAYAAVRSPAFRASDTGKYWAMRTMAAARVGNLDDARTSAQVAADRQLDAASLLFAAGSAAIEVGHRDVGGQLRVAALDYQSRDVGVLGAQATLQLRLALHGVGTLAKADAAIAKAETGGCPEDELHYLRLIRALIGDNADRTRELAKKAPVASWNPEALFDVATQAESRGWSGLALRCIDRLPPGFRVEGMPAPEAVRASALLRLEQWPAAAEACEAVLAAPAHPVHFVIAAYGHYAAGRLADALTALDQAQDWMSDPFELPLRLLVLMELGHHAVVASLLAKYFSKLPIAKNMAFWAEKAPMVDAPGLANAWRASPRGAESLELARRMYKASEFAVVHARNGALGGVIVAVDWWESGFGILNAAGEGVPVLVRTTPVPRKTISRLRGPAR